MRIHRWLLLTALLGLSAPAFAAEIPSGLDRRFRSVDAGAALQGAGIPDAAARAQALDQVELAELSQADLRQQGGETIITIMVIIAVVAMVFLYFQHVENMAH